MTADMNQSLEFAPDDKLTGFRLKRIEVYNWGTFHDRIWEFDLGGYNGLLTGDIGSGKSTLVDAVTTLLVPANRVSYNKAAGAEFKERSLKSYVLGYYKSERSDRGYSAKPVALRDRNSYSVILGTFYNAGYEQTVTLAQVFWQKETAGQPARFYITADKELTIRDHFTDFGTDISILRKRLRGMDLVDPPFDSFPPYGAAFRRRFGLKSDQALDLFHQTVSLKSIGNLTGFVRENMLEAFDLAPRIEELIHHFDDLNRAHEAVLRAKAQIERLSPMIKDLESHKSLESQTLSQRECRDGLRPYFAIRKSGLLSERIEKQNILLEKQKLKIEGLSSQRRAMRAERDGLKQAITENGGDRLEALKTEVSNLETDRNARLEKFESYQELCVELGLKKAKNADGFVENRAESTGRLGEIEFKAGELQNRYTEQSVIISNQKNNYDSLNTEIESLKRRRSNINDKQIRIRRRMTEDLGITEEALPFAGELINVKEEESAWEGAIERVLHNFALSLLVPEEHYKNVSEWVDGTDLRGRLVYYKVTDLQSRAGASRVVGTLPDKVRVKPDSPFRVWLDYQLSSRFDYDCCDNLEIFRKVKKGLTRYGQIKGASARHEKDDRHSLNDRSRFVLGWTNQAKIRALMKNRQELEASMAAAAEILSEIDREKKKFEKEKDKLKNLLFYKNWEDLDWKPAAERISRLEQEIKRLEKSSDKLKTLNESLSLLEDNLQSVENELESFNRETAKIEERRDSYTRLLEVEEITIAESELPVEDIKKLVEPCIEAYLSETKLTVDNCDKQQQTIRDRLQKKIDAMDKRVKNLGEKIVSAMTSFRNDYPSETRDFDAAIDSGPEYEDLLRQLKSDDLPKYEARFKKQLNENTIREIAGFQAMLNREHRQIEERIESINRSMASIEYNRGRYIKLELLQTTDMEIRGFRQELRNCTEGTLGGNQSEQYTEDKFIQVKAIVDRFKGREGTSELDRKWTRKVTDVRNWFAFAASERWKEDDSEYEHYTDSGGKSGGQKEKLAYTVLAASLAYQFGLEWGEVRSRSFRFVVIDEAFGRGSDESTRFGLELFRQLNLQFLLITPLQKINIIEPYVSSIGFVHNEDGMKSLLRTITIEEYRREAEKKESEGR